MVAKQIKSARAFLQLIAKYYPHEYDAMGLEIDKGLRDAIAQLEQHEPPVTFITSASGGNDHNDRRFWPFKGKSKIRECDNCGEFGECCRKYDEFGLPIPKKYPSMPIVKG